MLIPKDPGHNLLPCLSQFFRLSAFLVAPSEHYPASRFRCFISLSDETPASLLPLLLLLLLLALLLYYYILNTVYITTF